MFQHTYAFLSLANKVLLQLGARCVLRALDLCYLTAFYFFNTRLNLLITCCCHIVFRWAFEHYSCHDRRV